MNQALVKILSRAKQSQVLKIPASALTGKFFYYFLRAIASGCEQNQHTSSSTNALRTEETFWSKH